MRAAAKSSGERRFIRFYLGEEADFGRMETLGPVASSEGTRMSQDRVRAWRSHSRLEPMILSPRPATRRRPSRRPLEPDFSAW
jgi:hypothetical protein